MKGLKVLILSKEFVHYHRRLLDCSFVDVSKANICATKDVTDLQGNANKFDIVLGEPSLIKDVIDKIEGLKWVHSTWAGVEPLVTPSMRRDYILSNSRGIFGSLMSEYVFGYILFRERRIMDKLNAQKEKMWDGSWTGTLMGKTIGLLGVGSIGAHLASTAKHFQMQVRGYTQSDESCSFVDKYYHGDSLLDFASGLDFVVCTLPNTPKTAKIIDATFLAKLPETCVLVNVGRGQSIDDNALIKALRGGKIAAAVLDVFATEPLPKDDPYWTTPNVFITGHTSAPSYADAVYEIFEENLKLFTENNKLKYLVDFDKGY